MEFAGHHISSLSGEASTSMPGLVRHECSTSHDAAQTLPWSLPLTLNEDLDLEASSVTDGQLFNQVAHLYSEAMKSMLTDYGHCDSSPL